MPNKNLRSNDIINLLDRKLKRYEEGSIIPFSEFLNKTRERPFVYLRNVFQLFSDMIYHYIEIEDEYTNYIGRNWYHVKKLCHGCVLLPYSWYNFSIKNIKEAQRLGLGTLEYSLIEK